MMSINEIMTADPITLGPEDTLVDAGLLMKENRIRHIPIVNEKRELLGLITQRDLLATASGLRDSYSAGEIMRRKVHTITEDSNMRGAALMMQKYKIGALPVIRDNKLVGIVTDSDYVALSINLLEQLEEIDAVEPDEFDEVEELSNLSVED